MQTLKVSIGSHTSKGIKIQNEDCSGAIVPEGPQLTHKGIAVVIADGMSGCENGQQASHCCVAGFLEDYYSTPDSWTVKSSGQNIIAATNTWLYSQGLALSTSNKGLVSTLSAIVLKSNTGHIFHVGDSRIYRLRKGNMEVMTKDHRIWASRDTNYLNRAMGIEPRLEVDYKAFPLQLGDLFLMTTDGVHDFIDDKAVRKILNSKDGLDKMAENLVNLATEKESTDNLTSQLVKIEQLPSAKEDEILRRHVNLPFPPDLGTGMILDGYRIEEELHASSRTQIYRAYDTQTSKQVILKTPSVNYDDNPQFIENFLHEEWAGKRIHNKHVLKVLDTDRAKKFIYYVTEHLEGQTLREWMNNNKKPYIREIRKMVKQIENGLNAFHRMEMLHQDLKPENIMITTDGTLKIIDFGSVRIAGIAEITPLDKMEKDEENVLGTLNYTAPEYHLGQRGSIKSDLYSLGVITYEMINGRLPFGKEMPEKPDKMNLAKLEYVPSIHVNPMVPHWIDSALKKATSINPIARYDSISEFTHDITSPNQLFLHSVKYMPLIERNPLVFWKSIAAFMLLGNFILLYLLSQ